VQIIFVSGNKKYWFVRHNVRHNENIINITAADNRSYTLNTNRISW